MDRAQQQLSNFIYRYVQDNSRMPTEAEISKYKASPNMYAPISAPWVPLKGAKSNSLHIRNAILDLLQDKFNIEDLLDHLKRKISRNSTSSVLEITSLVEKTNGILNKYYRNNFNVIYNDVPILYSSADVSDFYLSIIGDELYVEEDDVPSDPTYLAQYIDVDSFNIRSGKEGLSLTKTDEKIINSNIEISTYSEEGFINKTVLNKVNPISTILSGATNANKGLTLSIPLVDKRISTIDIDTDPVTISVIIDGRLLFTKSLDGKSTLNINKTIGENITLNVYSPQTQVHINIRNIALFESTVEAGGTYKNGEYITLALPVGTKYGNLKFFPDQFIPKDTSIIWEYSSSRLDWELMEEDGKGAYKNIEWNSTPGSVSASVVSIADTDLVKIANLDDKARGIKIKTGKDSILFKRKENGTGSFIFYLEPLDDTGYHLELGNVMSEYGLFITNIIVTSDDFSHAEEAGDTISVELPAGLFKVVLEINNNIIFQPLSAYRDLSLNKNIKDILYENFLINFNLSLGKDRLEREVSSWIQGHSLTEDDLHRLSYRNPDNQINYFSTNYKKDVIVKPYTLNDNYDILLNNYNVESDQIIPAEIQYYAGSGEAWTPTLYHTPVGDVTFNSTSADYTPNSEGIITIPALADTTTYERDLLVYAGEDSNALYETEQTYISGTPVLELINISNNTFSGYKETYSQTFSMNTTNNVGELDFIPLLLENSLAVDTSKITVVSEDDGTEHDINTVSFSHDTPTLINVDTTYLSGTAENIIVTYGYSELQGQADEALGEELVTNGGFTAWTADDPDGWTVTGEVASDPMVTQSGNAARMFTTDSAVDIKQAVLTATKYYKIIINVISVSTGGINIRTSTSAFGTINVNYKSINTTGVHSFYLTALGTIFQILRNGSTDITFSDVSVKEVLAVSDNFSFTHTKPEIISGNSSATNDIILDRLPENGANEIITITNPEGPTSTTDTPTLDPVLDVYVVNAGTTFAPGTEVLVSYSTKIIIEEQGDNIQLSNLPVASTIKKEYNETGLAYEASATSELLLEHPAIEGTTVLSVNGSSNVTHTLTGNKLVIDLSPYATADGPQQPIELAVSYKSYEHTSSFKAYVSYDYYKATPYTFKYTYNMSRAASLSELYTNSSMVSQFYDISYYIAGSDDLYLKARLSSNGIESPIIRRLRFERTD